MKRTCSTEGNRNACSILVGKAKGKRPLGRLRHGLEDNIKMGLKIGRMGWYGLH
jgi:hypothetical protein